MLETLTEALVRFRGEGYGAELYATPEGHLACRACNTVGDPSTIRIDHTVRFEGNTDPGDEAILLAITCECGIRGLYTSAYGPNATPEDGAVLRRVAARQRRGSGDAAGVAPPDAPTWCDPSGVPTSHR